MNWTAWALVWVDAQLEAILARVDVLTERMTWGIVKVSREELLKQYPEPEGARRRRKRKGRQ